MPMHVLVVQILLLRGRKTIAPGSTGGSSFLSSADVVASRISFLDFPASASFVFIRKICEHVRAAAGLESNGGRVLWDSRIPANRSGWPTTVPQGRESHSCLSLPSCILWVRAPSPRLGPKWMPGPQCEPVRFRHSCRRSGIDREAPSRDRAAFGVVQPAPEMPEQRETKRAF